MVEALILDAGDGELQGQEATHRANSAWSDDQPLHKAEAAHEVDTGSGAGNDDVVVERPPRTASKYLTFCFFNGNTWAGFAAYCKTPGMLRHKQAIAVHTDKAYHDKALQQTGVHHFRNKSLKN